jgi:hypothetical protein
VTPLEAGLAISAALDRAAIAYALGGALALSFWAVPRATADVDVNVFVHDSELQSMCDALSSIGLPIDVGAARAASDASGLIVARWNHLRIDLFTPSIEFSWEAMRTRRRVSIEGTSVCLLSPEALAVFKLLFFRPKDIADLQRLIGVQGRALDVAYVRSWIVVMMGEEDERVGRWDALVAAHGAR